MPGGFRRSHSLQRKFARDAPLPIARSRTLRLTGEPGVEKCTIQELRGFGSAGSSRAQVGLTGTGRLSGVDARNGRMSRRRDGSGQAFAGHGDQDERSKCQYAGGKGTERRARHVQSRIHDDCLQQRGHGADTAAGGLLDLGPMCGTKHVRPKRAEEKRTRERKDAPAPGGEN